MLLTRYDTLAGTPARHLPGWGKPLGGLAPYPEKELLQQRVSKDCVAKVLFQGKATQQAVEKLVAYLNLMKDTLPSEA